MAGAPGIEELKGFLLEVQLFSELSDELREQIAASSTTVRVCAGEWLFRKGDPGDDLYIVRSGRLEALDDDHPAAVLGLFGRGTAFGELALLTHGRRAASIRAVRDTELIALTRQQFADLLTRDGRFGLALTTTLARQIQRSTGLPPAGTRREVLTLLPLGVQIRVDEVADRFVEELSRNRRAIALRRPPDVDPQDYGELLDRLEAQHDHVVLVAPVVEPPGASPDPWADFCLRQADRTVALAPPGATPPPQRDRAPLAGCDLAVVGRRPGRAGELAPWLDDLGARAVHWVADGPDFGDGVARMARRVSGQSLGVVMSGGGARGFAHLGVVQALAEAGVTIDRFGGTSIGAFMSALFACALPPDEAFDVCRRELVERRPYSDYTFPRFSVLRGRRAMQVLQRLFGSLHVEEMPRSWYSVSADVLAAEVVVHRRGPVWDSILASVSLPGFSPPRPHGDRLLVDGGTLNNLPTDVMADADEGPVIAVDVMSRWGAKWRERHDLERWQRSLWHRLGWTEPLPSVVETLAASSVMGSWRHTQRNRERAALTITPDLARFELFDWKRLDEIAEEGRRAAETAIAAVPGHGPASTILATPGPGRPRGGAAG